tara:strand:- start:357 stop:518 length:162 start_codon:yes stop_codon:yes gene_type:complete
MSNFFRVQKGSKIKNKSFFKTKDPNYGIPEDPVRLKKWIKKEEIRIKKINSRL